MRKERLPVSKRQILERFLSFAKRAPQGIEGMPLHVLIQLLRARLQMTQAQLAKRVHLPQSHIAKIESGRGNMQWSTIQKIFRALYSEALILPLSPKNLDAVIAERVKETAKRRVSRVMGTMSLEKQLPSDAMIQNLVKEEEQKLKSHPSSEIWEE